jgi:hypothetical protein
MSTRTVREDFPPDSLCEEALDWYGKNLQRLLLQGDRSCSMDARLNPEWWKYYNRGRL